LLPSSFEGEHGSVRYTIKATLDRPWKFDHEVTVPFKVVTPIDLNFNNKAKVRKTERNCLIKVDCIILFFKHDHRLNFAFFFSSGSG
jgi:hypothetical protein